MRQRHVPNFLLSHPACAWAPGPPLLSSSSSSTATYASSLSSFSSSSSLHTKLAPPAQLSPARPRQRCSLCGYTGPPLYDSPSFFSVVAKTTEVGSLSAGQPLCFTVAQTKTQCLSSHWKQKTYGFNIRIISERPQVRLMFLNSVWLIGSVFPGNLAEQTFVIAL